MRRGVMVLAVGPGLVAVFGDLPWSSMTILPGLVASGGALLFGVNAWSLDGRGALWRESLPVTPSNVFDARAWVITEFLAVASFITLGLGALRAGIPNGTESAALLCTLVVVLLQVVGASMRWSLLHPYPADMRSARATPAPPATMVGYSARLAVSTTFTGLFFSACSKVPDSAALGDRRDPLRAVVGGAVRPDLPALGGPDAAGACGHHDSRLARAPPAGRSRGGRPQCSAQRPGGASR